ncbi:MAG: hypothetical protein KDC52_02115 [Ignavibacteriae bacterium]|nr:hypothetical protein [Ignavibacteriota bacterium]
MLNQKFKFSTKMKIAEILEKLEEITTNKTILGNVEIRDDYFGSYNKSGFNFIKSGARPLGTNIFNSKFIEHDLNTEIFVSIKPSTGTIFMYSIIILIMLIGIIVSNINFNIIKLITLIFLLMIPLMIAYFSIIMDSKKAKKFLSEVFQTKEL